MRLEFPENFRFGTSTSAVQIETAVDHDWEELIAEDSSVFARTTDHELRLGERCGNHLFAGSQPPNEFYVEQTYKRLHLAAS
ncbi:MAG: hypothetical protein U5K54_14195 [Cytophagales bacterium]|nr:hypothetical protein [Cytophagales bacterium]